MVGSDRAAANGDFANMIGTYALAVAARYHRILFSVVTPVSTVDPDCPNGEGIPIEQRDAQEIRGVSGAFGCCRWAPERSDVANPAFDVTPAGLVTAWILDSGLYLPEDSGSPCWWQRRGDSHEAAPFDADQETVADNRFRSGRAAVSVAARTGITSIAR